MLTAGETSSVTVAVRLTGGLSIGYRVTGIPVCHGTGLRGYSEPGFIVLPTIDAGL